MEGGKPRDQRIGGLPRLALALSATLAVSLIHLWLGSELMLSLFVPDPGLGDCTQCVRLLAHASFFIPAEVAMINGEVNSMLVSSSIMVFRGGAPNCCADMVDEGVDY